MFSNRINDKSAGRPGTPAVSERPIRSLVKAISWRVTGSIDTMLLSWFFTGNLKIAAAIGLTEVVTKMALYYFHERVWNRITLGRTGIDKKQDEAGPVPGPVNTNPMATESP